MKRILFILLTWFAFIGVWADVKVTAEAPEAVVVGEEFRLSFTINSQQISDFKAPDLSAFEVLIGPNSSSFNSIQIINGKTSHVSTVTITYILQAAKEGTFTLGPASVTVDGKTLRSNSLKIRVLPSGRSSQGNTSRQNSSVSDNQSTGGKDLFMTVSASKKRVFEQEAVLLTYKVFSQVDLRQLAGDMADMDGFHTQEIPLPQEKSMKLEHHNGQNYRTVIWKQYVLFPQKTGKLTVPSIKFEGLVLVQNRNIDPFDAFFGGQSVMSEVKRTIVAPSVTIDVEALPARPANFSGAVGKYNVSASLSPRQLKTNDAITLRVVVSGQGNMKLITAPTVKFPKDFETYDAKVTDKTTVGVSGTSGNKVFDYIAVPRHAGKYEIPPVEFCYFDTDSRSYKTVTTESFQVDVAKGKEGTSEHSYYTDKEELKLLGTDVRYIKTGDPTLRKRNTFFYGTSSYILCYAIPFLLFVMLVIIFRKQAIENANVAKRRGKKANKVAAKRLKNARTLLRGNQRDAFYDEILKALWGYVSDKLTIAVADLNKDNVQDALRNRGVDDSTVNAFIQLLNEGEFARFAPGDANATMDKIFVSAEEIIGTLENAIKPIKGNK